MSDQLLGASCSQNWIYPDPHPEMHKAIDPGLYAIRRIWLIRVALGASWEKAVAI